MTRAIWLRYASPKSAIAEFAYADSVIGIDNLTKNLNFLQNS